MILETHKTQKYLIKNRYPQSDYKKFPQFYFV